MVSMLEDMLLRYINGTARLRQLLLEYLDDCSLRKMRLVSRVLHNIISRYPDRIFEQLYVSTPWLDYTEMSSLNAVAPFCRILTVKIGHEIAHTESRPRKLLQRLRPKSDPESVKEHSISARERWRMVGAVLAISSRKSSPSSTAPSVDHNPATTPSTTSTSSKQPASSRFSGTSARHVWISLLSRCEQLQSIVISTSGKSGWPGKTRVEDDLTDLRLALEAVHLPHVRRVSLTPVHAMGIVHLRWSGFGAFGALAVKPFNVWSNLYTLDVQLENPFSVKQKLSGSQQVMFKKILYDYLLSFAETLKCLRFIWLNEDGPSPMTLELEPGLEGYRQAIVWTVLEEVYLGNITLPHRTIRLLPERVVRAGVQLKILRSTHMHSRVNWDDDNAWVKVLSDFTPHDIERGNAFSQASSVYSQ